MTLEKDIEDKFVNFAAEQGCEALKLVLLGLRGFPDRTVLCPGNRIFFIEFKRPGGKTSGAQDFVIKILMRLGFSIYVCSNLKAAKQILITELEKPNERNRV